eukprot:CAMPEP_0196808738 /NCGR_PEP_ID=MMETSP1362-20130617/8730_1 /TAXON_ID=163516 /ORGANISM="Leptocylindrus danicus, Strain CCMP1856" /LENGTH=896 /DNA_ID=CAMNT_0042183181 /DNA_START=121 /DNA_END=2808 /DNA_ORIENTATION=+
MFRYGGSVGPKPSKAATKTVPLRNHQQQKPHSSKTPENAAGDEDSCTDISDIDAVFHHPKPAVKTPVAVPKRLKMMNKMNPVVVSSVSGNPSIVTAVAGCSPKVDDLADGGEHQKFSTSLTGIHGGTTKVEAESRLKKPYIDRSLQPMTCSERNDVPNVGDNERHLFRNNVNPSVTSPTSLTDTKCFSNNVGKKYSDRLRIAQKQPGLTKSKHQRIFVTHNYTDYMDEKPTADEIRWVCNELKKPIKRQSFLVKLYNALKECERDNMNHVFHWLPHGRAFIIDDLKKFEEIVLPKYLKMDRYTSFLKQCHLYNFQRLTRGSGDESSGSRYHPYFLKGKMFLCRRVKRTKVKGHNIRPAAVFGSEPNLFALKPCVDVDSENEARSIHNNNERRTIERWMEWVHSEVCTVEHFMLEEVKKKKEEVDRKICEDEEEKKKKKAMVEMTSRQSPHHQEAEPSSLHQNETTKHATIVPPKLSQSQLLMTPDQATYHHHRQQQPIMTHQAQFRTAAVSSSTSSPSRNPRQPNANQQPNSNSNSNSTNDRSAPAVTVSTSMKPQPFSLDANSNNHPQSLYAGATSTSTSMAQNNQVVIHQQPQPQQIQIIQQAPLGNPNNTNTTHNGMIQHPHQHQHQHQRVQYISQQPQPQPQSQRIQIIQQQAPPPQYITTTAAAAAGPPQFRIVQSPQILVQQASPQILTTGGTTTVFNGVPQQQVILQVVQNPQQQQMIRPMMQFATSNLNVAQPFVTAFPAPSSSSNAPMQMQMNGNGIGPMQMQMQQVQSVSAPVQAPVGGNSQPQPAQQMIGASQHPHVSVNVSAIPNDNFSNNTNHVDAIHQAPNNMASVPQMHMQMQQENCDGVNSAVPQSGNMVGYEKNQSVDVASTAGDASGNNGNHITNGDG